jgi:hypothetical protein
LYNQVNLVNTEIQIETGYNDNLTYIIKEYKKIGADGKKYPTNIIMMKPNDFLQIMTTSRCVKEFRQYFIKLASIQRSYRVTYLPWIDENKNSHISQLTKKVDDLLKVTKETNKIIKDQSNDLTEIKEINKINKSYLEEKSFVSTLNPTNNKLHHYFGATTYIENDKQIVKFVTGQNCYVTSTINKLIRDSEHTVIIKTFYNANGIDLRHNVYDAFAAKRYKIVTETNELNKKNDTIYNTQLKLEISTYNKNKPNIKRVYSQEKKTSKTIKLKDISVDFTKLKFVYIPNKYISLQEVIDIILDVNQVTQKSPAC